MHQIDPMNRERARAVLVDFRRTNFKFEGKLYPPGIPQVIPYLHTEPDLKFQLCSQAIVISDIGFSTLITLYKFLELP